MVRGRSAGMNMRHIVGGIGIAYIHIHLSLRNTRHVCECDSAAQAAVILGYQGILRLANSAVFFAGSAE